MIWFIVFASGLVIGLVVGRWWALLAAVAFGAYVAFESEVEGPGVLGLLYAAFGGAGIAVGVLLRRQRAR